MLPASASARSKPRRSASSGILQGAARFVTTSNKNLLRRLGKVESRNITYVSGQFPIFWESAEGSEVRDVRGDTYLDLTSAFAVSSLGHSAPAIQRAIVTQSRKMWHGMGDVHPNAVKV